MNREEASANAFWLQWKKRKRACMDIVDMLSEGMEKHRREVIELVQIETDEDNNVAID